MSVGKKNILEFNQTRSHENEKLDTKKSDLAAFNQAIDEAKRKYGVESEKELVEKMEPSDRRHANDPLAIVKLNGLALTESGQLTRTVFLENLMANQSEYDEIVLTADEADTLRRSYRVLSTGVSATVPLMCTGSLCPFKDTCAYFQMNKAPIGRRCLIERDLLIYHTQKFMEEFDVQPQDHSELMLIQELAETIIYEMRLSNNLAKAGSSELYDIKLQITKQGDEIEEYVPHWAVELKEKMKNRRMKILEALNGTRAAKFQIQKESNKFSKGGDGETGFNQMVNKWKNIIEQVKEISENMPTNTEVKEVRDETNN